MIEGGYSAGSTIASQTRAVPARSPTSPDTGSCSTTSTTARPTSTRARGSAAGRATTASGRSPRPCTSSSRSGRMTTPPGGQARRRHGRGPRAGARVRAAPRAARRPGARRRHPRRAAARDGRGRRERGHSRWSTRGRRRSAPQQTGRSATPRRDALGGLDALVNNAAIVGACPAVRSTRSTRTSGTGCSRSTSRARGCAHGAVAPLLREAGGGSIVNLASEVAFSGSAGLAHYVASKAAIIGLTRVLARELGPSQIRVNAIAPGFIPTEGRPAMLADAHVRPERHAARPRRSARRPARGARVPRLRREHVRDRPDAARQRRATRALTRAARRGHPGRVMYLHPGLSENRPRPN